MGSHRLGHPRPCATCGADFRPRQSLLDAGKGLFCSQACNTVAHRAAHAAGTNEKRSASMRKAHADGRAGVVPSGAANNNWKGGRAASLARNREAAREQNRRYCKEYPHKIAAKVALRNAAKARATPAWANTDAVLAVYAEANRLTAETGIKHHVDHIVPLRGRTVSGLHVEYNLQVLTAEENMRKGNRLPQL